VALGGFPPFIESSLLMLAIIPAMPLIEFLEKAGCIIRRWFAQNWPLLAMSPLPSSRAIRLTT
jgi:hypothetical protein